MCIGDRKMGGGASGLMNPVHALATPSRLRKPRSTSAWWQEVPFFAWRASCMARRGCFSCFCTGGLRPDASDREFGEKAALFSAAGCRVLGAVLRKVSRILHAIEWPSEELERFGSK